LFLFFIFSFSFLLATLASLTSLLAALAAYDVSYCLIRMACNGLADISNETNSIIHDATATLECRTADVTTRLNDVLNWRIYATEYTS